MHRLYHVPLVGEDQVDHYADGYNNLVALAKGENYTDAGRNSASLSYFALEVYAFDVAIPGEGCVGKPVEGADDGHGHVVTSSSSVLMSSATSVIPTEATSVNPIRVIPAETTPATQAAASPTAECHYHADGTQHCT